MTTPSPPLLPSRRTSQDSQSPQLPPVPQSPQTRPRVPLPGLPSTIHSSQPPSPPLSCNEKQKRKTAREKAKGEQLKDPAIGVQADTRCARCEATHNRCLVARDPRKFGTFKCGRCISSKQKCSFSVDNPGVKYDGHCIDSCREKEHKKQVAYRKYRHTIAQNKNQRLAATTGAAELAAGDG